MKKLLLPLLLIIPIFVLAQKGDINWDYPVKPGTEAWKSLKSGRAMIEVCQLPEDIITKISTHDLAIVCLNYPMKINAFLFDNLQVGFQKVFNSFNGLQELFSRNDAGSALLNLYKNLKLNENTISGTNLKNIDAFTTCFLELILAQEGFLNKIAEKDKIDLMKQAMNNLNYKFQSGKSLFEQETSAIILSRVYLDVSYDNASDYLSNKRFESFNKYLVLKDASVIVDIKHITGSFIDNYK